MKKLLAIVLTLSLLAACIVPAAAENSNKCGDDLTYTIEPMPDGSGDYKVVISGTGPMYDYSAENPAPWASVANARYCFVQPGVTSIGDYAFARSTGNIWLIASTVTEIGEYAWNSENGSITFLGKTPVIASTAFTDAYLNVFYTDDWSTESNQDYGAVHAIWRYSKALLNNQTKKVYLVNEAVCPEDFVMRIYGGKWLTFSPAELSDMNAYDNSVCGEKQIDLKICGQTFTHKYYVTDGQCHLADMKVSAIDPVQSYKTTAIELQPEVSLGSVPLYKDVDYTLSYENNHQVGAGGKVTVTGLGRLADFTKTQEFAIQKRDISNEWVSIGAKKHYQGMPIIPTASVTVDGVHLTAGQDYIVYAENNVNMGTATVYVVGIGNYCGSASRDFEINNVQQAVELDGAYMGQAGGELAEQTYYSEYIITPGVFEARINSTVGHYTLRHQAYYELYRMVGEDDMTLVTSYESDYGHSDDTKFTYDFSSVYEGSTEDGGEIYVLISVWVNSENAVYSNTALLAVPAKVPDGTEMVVEEVEGTATFRNAYLSAYSPDGNLGKPTWTSSDPTVATVENGVVTKLTPGTVTITGQWNGLSASYSLTVEKQNLANGTILSYNPTGETAKIYYQGQLLEAGKDYALTATQSGDNATVTVTGCGLFAGQLVRTFNAAGEPVDHTHGYDHACDTTCNFCDVTRVTQHAFGTEWEKDLNNHWYECTVCGEKKDQDGHTISPEDPNLCTVCGKIGIPGDIDGNRQVNSDDVVQLLLHISMPDLFPITVNADYTGDGKVTSDDVVQLLLHISMPDLFPLQ